jgi:hypothetical protein
MRAAVDKVQLAMNEYRPLMRNSTQKRIDMGVKYGTALSEVSDLFSVKSIPNPFR